MTSICSTCLSQDRHMKPLESIPLFKTLHWLKLHLVVSAPMVCWECEAALTRAERFRRRAARAQGALRALELQPDQCHQPLTSLTTLSAVGPYTYTHTNYNNDIKLDHLMKNETDDIEDPVKQEGSTTIIEWIKTEDDDNIEHTDALMDVTSEDNSESDTYNESPQLSTSFSLSENGEKERDDILEPHEQFIVDKDSTLVAKDQSKTPAPDSIHIAEPYKATNEKPLARYRTRLGKRKINNTTDEIGVKVNFKLPPCRTYSRINKTQIDTEMTDRVSLLMDNVTSSSPLTNKLPNSVPMKKKTGKVTKPKSRKSVRKHSYDFNKRLRDNIDYKIVIVSEQEMIANIKRARSNPMGSETGKGTSKDTSQADPFQLFQSETQPPPSEQECPLCSLHFYDEQKLIQHCVDFHRTLYQCLKCSYQNFLTDHIYKHYKETHNVFLCQYCFVQLESDISLRNHIAENHNAKACKKGPLECEKCGKIFGRPGILRDHMQTHLDKETRKQQCPHCKKKVLLLRRHIKINHNTRTERQCPQCDTVVMGDVKLKHHILTVHTRNPESYCEPCDKQFEYIGQYNHHLKYSRAHNPNPTKFQCQHCIKQFTSKTTLQSHVEVVHELKKPFVCETCGKACGTRKLLLEHMRRKHETNEARRGLGRNKQICQYCGIEFKTATTFAVHLRTHTGEKPYHCAHCDWQFRQRGPLVTHLRGMHPGRVPPRRKRQ